MAKPNDSLVFVVGAGASKEAGLPTGYELKGRIATALKTRLGGIHQRMICENEFIEKALWQICQKQADRQQQNINSYHSACKSIADGMQVAPSIDHFINAHRHDSEITICGKLGIAYCILSAESGSESKMQVNNQNINNTINFIELEETWYNSFFHLIVDGCQLEDIPDRLSRITIITLNYDRCIEHYLYHSLRCLYPQISPEQVAKLLENLEIYHPYGYLGPLPWVSNSAVNFGGVAITEQLVSMAHGLKTFTEGIDKNSSDVNEIRATIRSAERVVFLGFAFAEQNLELLYGSNKPATAISSSVYATAYGLSESDVQVIKNDLHDISGHQPPNIHIHNDLTCVNLLREYGRSLKIRQTTIAR